MYEYAFQLNRKCFVNILLLITTSVNVLNIKEIVNIEILYERNYHHHHNSNNRKVMKSAFYVSVQSNRLSKKKIQWFKQVFNMT